MNITYAFHNFMIMVVDIYPEEYFFILEYNTGGESKRVLSELIRVHNLCEVKGYGFDFFEIAEDPNYALNKEGIYIHKYNQLSDVLRELDIKLTKTELAELRLKNKNALDILMSKSKEELIFILNDKSENHELLKKIFEKK